MCLFRFLRERELLRIDKYLFKDRWRSQKVKWERGAIKERNHGYNEG